jgi:Protein of unknown function (DUF2752)
MREPSDDSTPNPPVAAEPDFHKRMRSQRAGLVLILSLIFAACVAVYFWPPEEYTYLPGCTLNRMTGLYCPGCGGTRAASALMHGDVLQAAAYNLYFLLALPFVLWWGGYGIWATLTGKQFGPPGYRPWLFTFIWMTIIAFAVLRNIPVSPFNWLAPHKL